MIRYMPRDWTVGSIFCYRRGCNCEGCYVKDLLTSQPCRMKKAVIELVKQLGAPPKEQEGFNESETKVINAILSGAKSYSDIEKITGIKHSNVLSVLSHLYQFADIHGCVFFNKRFKLPDFIRWLKEGEL